MAILPADVTEVTRLGDNKLKKMGYSDFNFVCLYIWLYQEIPILLGNIT